MTIEKGDLLYRFYKQELITYFDNKNLSLDEIKSTFNKLDYKSVNDFALIMDAKTGEILYKSKDLNISDTNFLSNYTLEFYSASNGQCLQCIK